MAFERGPESAVCVPGAMDRAESSDVAKVSVTWGRSVGGEEDGGR